MRRHVEQEVIATIRIKTRSAMGYVSSIAAPSGKQILAPSFPNRSRFYDAARRAVRLWGYDNAMETSFFVTEDALKRIQPGMEFDEVGVLSAFDANRDRIYATAAKVYARGRRGSYDIVGADF
jgi:Protein of unknown function (DUF1488)